MPFYNALHTNRWQQPGLEQTSGSFLAEKYATGDPVRMYTTFRIWNECQGWRNVIDKAKKTPGFPGLDCAAKKHRP